MTVARLMALPPDALAAYEAARRSAIQVERNDRTFLRVHGRDPVRMIGGLVSNDVAGTPPGGAVYAAMLTPKGKMIADLRILRRPGDELILDIPLAAAPGVEDHLRRSVPPLFARFERADLRMVGVYGPDAPARVGDVLGMELELATDVEDACWSGTHGTAQVHALRTCYAGGEPGYDLLVPAERWSDLAGDLREAGVERASPEVLEVLRIEGGTPRWGAELTDAVIPLEAGLRARAISETKGCYTGQEVIIRILHRGHVNWMLMGLVIPDDDPPEPGATAARPEAPKVVARITSSCVSPRLAQAVALGFVRREVEPGDELVLEDGRRARVVDLPFVGGGV